MVIILNLSPTLYHVHVYGCIKHYYYLRCAAAPQGIVVVWFVRLSFLSVRDF